MVREGHDVTVFTTNANGKEKLKERINTLFTINGVNVFYFNRLTGDHSNFTPRLLQKLWFSARSFEVIHLHSWWNLVIMPAVFICMLRGIRPVLSPRGSITQYTFSHSRAFVKRCVHHLVGKSLMRHCLLHVTSRQEEEDVKKYTKEPLVHLIPNLLDLKDQMVISHRNQEQLHLIYLGRIDPKKNIEFLLDVVLHHFNIPFTLEFVGEGFPAYVEGLKEKTSSHKSISWAGPVYDDRKWEKLASADILLLPSANENYGNVILEALSQGTAVVISDQVGLKDYIVVNQLGWVAGTDPAEWRKVLDLAYTDKMILRKIRSEAPSCIKRDFQQAAIVSQYVTMYNTVKKTTPIYSIPD